MTKTSVGWRGVKQGGQAGRHPSRASKLEKEESFCWPA